MSAGIARLEPGAGGLISTPSHHKLGYLSPLSQNLHPIILHNSPFLVKLTTTSKALQIAPATGDLVSGLSTWT